MRPHLLKAHRRKTDAPLLPQGLLGSWNASSDPCADAWAFTSCACADVYPALSAAACSNATGDASAQRVLVLGIGPVTQTQGRQLAGTLPACLGNLTALRTLDLHGNQLRVCRALDYQLLRANMRAKLPA